MGKKDKLGNINLDGDFTIVDEPQEFKPANIKLDGGFEVISQPKPQSNAYFDYLDKQQDLGKFNDIIQNIPDMGDSEKEVIKDLALKGLRGNELRDAILTLQKKHPRQDSGDSSKYYFDDKGIPRPLKNSERPPVGYEVASIWGSQKDANDDAWYTDLAKTVYNIIPSTAENIVDLAQTAYEGVTDKESEWLNTLKNSANYLKATKDEDLNKSMFNTQGIDEWSDLLDTKRLDFTPEAIWGTVNGLLGSVGEFAVGGGAAGRIAKGITGAVKLGKTTAITSNMVGSTLTNLGEVRDAATEIGLTGRDRALFTSAVAPIISAIDVKWGLGTKMFGNEIAKDEKLAFLKALGKAIPRDEAGNITKAGIDELAKVTAVGYAQVAKKIGQLTTQDVLAEGGQEMSQQFVQNAAEQLWDKLTPEEQKKFGTDAFSPESFGEYIQNGLAGLMGGAPTVFAYNKAKQMAKQDAQDNTAFDIAKGDMGKLYSFYRNANNELQQGKLTKEEYDNAIFKVDSYKQYWEQTKDSKLGDEDKKRVFGLTFEKANLENQIPSEYEEDKLNAIEQAKISVLKKQAKNIQSEIDKFFLKDEVSKKETENVAKKTIKEVADEFMPQEKGKKSAPITGIKDLYEQYGKELGQIESKPKKEPLDTRGYEAIPYSDWNQKKASEKFKILSQHLDNNNQDQVGEIQLMSGGKGKITNDTVHIKLPNDKWVIFASSATSAETKLRGHLLTEHLPTELSGQKVVIRPHRLTTGRIVLPVYNTENGKMVGYVREDNTGKADEKLFEQRALKLGVDTATKVRETESNELQHLLTTKLKQNEIEALKRPIGENQPGVEALAYQNQETAEIEETQPKVPKNVKKPRLKQFIEQKIEDLRDDPDADFDEGLVNDGTYEEYFTKQYEKQYGKIESTETASQAKPETRDTKETDGESGKESKEIKLRVGVKRIRQKIKSLARKKALTWEEGVEINTPYQVILQYFAGKGTISTAAIGELYGKKRNEKGELKAQQEKFKRNSYTTAEDKTPKGTESLDALAHTLWQDNTHVTPNANTEDYKDALELALQKNLTRNAMAEALNSAMEEGKQVQRFENEELMNEYYAKLESFEKEGDAIISALELLPDEYLEKLANDQSEFEKWEKENDAEIRNDIQEIKEDDIAEIERKMREEERDEDNPKFQKPAELVYAETELKKAEKELKASKTSFDSKRKELGKEINEDQEDLFGERKSTEGAGLFDERVDMSVYEGIIGPFKQRYDKAVQEFNKWTAKVKELQDKGDSQTSLFQRNANKQKNIDKVIKVIQKAIPSVKVVYDATIKDENGKPVAGKWSASKKTIFINPDYATTDTPIHEAGHILISAMGGKNNKVIRNAIKQLKGTQLWKETAELYPLSDTYTVDDLSEEVLAEAIGREGADIFDTESEKNVFMKYLDYIFDWLKRNLGLEKNVAKNLAKQIIAGINMPTVGDENVYGTAEKIRALWNDIKNSKDADQKRELSAERREILNANPELKYIDSNIKAIFDQLQKTDYFTYKGDCL